MRRSSFSLSFSISPLDVGATMSGRSRFRGGGRRFQRRRDFSERPWSAAAGNENQSIVSGDSHFQSVTDANLRLQRGANNSDGYRYGGGDRPPSRGRGGFRGQSYGQRPRLEPQFDPNLSSGFRPQPPPFSYGNQQFQPLLPWQLQQQRSPLQPHQRPKSDDFRRWEYAKSPPPPQCERFLVLSYNILADYLASSHRSKLYYHIPHYIMNWQRRRRSIVFELGLWSPDIICFQEIDKFHDLEDDLKHRGYMGIWKMRTGTPVDGCAIFWRASRFELVHEECIEFNYFGLRDNVAQICVLQSFIPNDNGSGVLSSTSSNGSNKVVICNIHVLYNPKRGEMKLGQVRLLLEKAQAVSKTWNDAPLVICGDFNCTPKSPLYNFISEQKLDISGIDRDKVSGQASAQLYPPPNQYNPRPMMNSNFCNDCTTVKEMGGDTEESVFSAVEKHTSPVINSESLSGSEEHIDSEIITKNITQPLPVGQNSSLKSMGSGLSSNIAKSITSESNSVMPQACDKSLNEPHESGSMEMHDGLGCNTQQDVVDSSKNEVARTSWVLNNDSRDRDSAKECSGLGSADESRDRGSAKESTSETWGADLDTVVEEKLNDLSLNEFEEVVKDEDIDDDVTGEITLAVDSETVDAKKTTYDPSTWASIDIATATGNGDCSLLEHSLKLKSTYSEVEGPPETRESSGEPIATSYNRCFLGTVDYIWRSEGLETVRVLVPLPKQSMLWTPGFPTKKWGSDHIALVSELAFTKGVRTNNEPFLLLPTKG